MSLAAVIAPSKTAVIGYVEALNGEEAVGWVWCPGHADRLQVELCLADETIGRAVADQNREDLARSGIGDGRHAFTLAIPAEARARLSELRVLAYPVEGQAVSLEPPPAATPQADTLVPLQRGIETLISSQRLLHRNLQAALLQQGPPATSTLADMAAAQAKLTEAMATVELFVVRIETALLTSEPKAEEPPRRWLAAAVGLSCFAFLASCLALYFSVASG